MQGSLILELVDSFTLYIWPWKGNLAFSLVPIKREKGAAP